MSVHALLIARVAHGAHGAFRSPGHELRYNGTSHRMRPSRQEQSYARRRPAKGPAGPDQAAAQETVRAAAVARPVGACPVTI